jgi:hypothetical protein
MKDRRIVYQAHLKRIILDVEPKFHNEIKVRAALRNISIKDYVETALNVFIQQYEKIPITTKE